MTNDYELLKNKKLVDEFLHDMYIETIKGAILEYFNENNIFDAWTQMHYLIDDIYNEQLITEDEFKRLIVFINTVYLEFCSGDKLHNSIEDIKNNIGKEENDDVGNQRRCNVNCGRNTKRTRTSGKTERENKND